MRERRFSFEAEVCIGHSPMEAMAILNLYRETEELRTAYIEETTRFSQIVKALGKQFWAHGTATDNMDGNTNREDSWYWRGAHTIHMEAGGRQARVLVDCFYEDDKSSREERSSAPSPYFWRASLPGPCSSRPKN